MNGGISYNGFMAKSSASREFAESVVRRLQEAGHLAYFAGGCVRDQLMGRVPADFDIATSALPEQVMAIFGRAQQVGVSFGVVLVRKQQQTVEVATFRTDGQYSDGRRPDSVQFATAEVDAQRRDFTCNGLFFDPVAKQLHDYVGGKADIEQCILRAIGNPEHRFGEDYLRMLRAVRFSARLNFTIEADTWAAICGRVARIGSISKERIGEELRMMLEHPARGKAAELLRSSGLLKEIWPAPLLGQTGQVEWQTLRAISDSEFTPLLEVGMGRLLALAAMQMDLWKSQGWAGEIFTSAQAGLLRSAFMLSNEETEALGWIGQKFRLVEQWPKQRVATLKRMCADTRWPLLFALWKAQVHDSKNFKGLTQRIGELAEDGVGIAPTPWVSGNDLIKLGAPPGRQFKQWLEELYNQQLENAFANREAALAAAKSLLS